MRTTNLVPWLVEAQGTFWGVAETFYIPVSPQDASGPINVVAGAEVMFATRLAARRGHPRAAAFLFRSKIRE